MAATTPRESPARGLRGRARRSWSTRGVLEISGPVAGRGPE